MLSRIYIHNYRTFVNFEWRPPPACVLVGENGAGKSALIEVLWLLQDIAVRGKLFEDCGFPASRTRWLNELEQTIEIDLAVGPESFHYAVSYRKVGTSGSIRETLSASDGTLYRSGDGNIELYGDRPTKMPRTTIPSFERTRSFLPVLEPRPDNRRIIAFRQALSAMVAVKPDIRTPSLKDIEESPELRRDLQNFVGWYRTKLQEDPDAALAFRGDLQQALPGFAQLRFEPLTPEVKDLRVRLSFGDQSHELRWPELSDGQRLLIALYGLYRFVMPGAGVVALDEIENFVAPAEIQPWLRHVTTSLAERNRQLIVVSHHPESIDYLAPDAVWRMWRDRTAGHTRIEQLTPDRNAGETAYDVVKLNRPDV